MSDDQVITLKIKDLPEMNELAYAKYKYDEALKTMLENPTQANIDAFGDANRKMFETEDLYRIGTKLLIEFTITHVR